MNFEELEKQIASLNTEFINLLIFNLMVKNKVKYEDVSKMYVRYLEHLKSENNDLISELAYSLVQHREPKLVGGTKEEKKTFMDNKAISALKRTRLFPENAPL